MVRIALILVLFVFLPMAAHAEKRVALLIGNKDYRAGVGSLVNPLNDVRVVGDALRPSALKSYHPCTTRAESKCCSPSMRSQRG